MSWVSKTLLQAATGATEHVAWCISSNLETDDMANTGLQFLLMVVEYQAVCVLSVVYTEQHWTVENVSSMRVLTTVLMLSISTHLLVTAALLP